MSAIKVHDKYFVPWLSEGMIQDKVCELAAQISEDYRGKRPLFVCILNGSFIFAADLFKNITLEAEISFIKLASYKGVKSSGHVLTAIGLDNDINGRDVVIVEDIIDTGKTLHHFLPQLFKQQPASVKIAVLLHKPDATVYHIDIDYCCFTIPNKFVVGYGLDYDGLGRNLKEIYQVQEG